VPIPYETLAAICRGEVSLQEFSKMRVFKTLFSEEGVSRDLKSQFWCQLINLQIKSEEEREMNELMFNDMANKRNQVLEDEISRDECNMRYAVMKKCDPLELIQPDQAKMERIIRAYGNSDPPVTFDQGYCYIVSGLLGFFSSEVEVYIFLTKLMFDFNWR